MEDFNMCYTTRLNDDIPATLKHVLQSSYPIEDIDESNEDSQRASPVSVMEDETTFQDSNTEMLMPAPSMINDREEELEATKDSANASVLEQADKILQMKLESNDPAMNKPIRSYLDESLPDLLRSGSPLRRRVSSPVSDTLKQVRREVELSRRRSIKLKAQVDKLQEESHYGILWSQQRERVTEDIQSTVNLLMPLTDFEPTANSKSNSERNSLDIALTQLKNVARTIALNHTAQGKIRSGMTDEVAVLEQALRDRDDALEKKKAMESELLKCKTEQMLLNNQLLEAVQRRLEMAIELEAWKDDVQTIIQHQLMNQQQAEQSQKKSRVFGVLRRSKQSSPIQSPVVSRPSSPSMQSPNTPVAQRWKDKLKRGRSGWPSSSASDQPSPNLNKQTPFEFPDTSKEDSFQTVSLD